MKENKPAESDKKVFDFWKHFASGAIAGAISRTITAPTDRLRLFRQTSTDKASIVDLTQYMLKEGGVRSLWRGNLLNVMKASPKQAIRFAVYNETKKFMLLGDNVQPNLRQRFIAGCIAGGVSHTLIYPLEMLKVRLTLRTTGKYTGILDAAVKIYKAEGWRSFGRGYTPSIVSLVPFSGLDLTCYELMKSELSARYQRLPTAYEQFCIGAASGFLAHLVVYPLLLVCVKMQADERDLVKYKKSMVQILLEIWEREGMAGLYRGMNYTMLKFLPMVGLTYVCYEQTMKFLNIQMTWVYAACLVIRNKNSNNNLRMTEKSGLCSRNSNKNKE